nr:hydroxyproline O-galactosyltransferase GALT6-like [Ipomoea batatas]
MVRSLTMKRESSEYLSRKKWGVKILTLMCVVYLVLVSLEAPIVYKTGVRLVSPELFGNGQLSSEVLDSRENVEEKDAPNRPLDVPFPFPPERRIKELRNHPLSSIVFDDSFLNASREGGYAGIMKSAAAAFEAGRKLWEELELPREEVVMEESSNRKENCPDSVSMFGAELSTNGQMMELPCGLTLGSHITVVGRPKLAHPESDPKISALEKGQFLMVSQFMMELQGLKAVDGEEPPRILHFNPRLKGDFSGKPVIELNTCYRMQWGTAQRCEGWQSKNDQKTEDKLFVLTLSAGVEGYHVNVDGRHVTSFPYHTGFTLEDATGLWLNGDIEVESVVATSLPTSYRSFTPQKDLDLSDKWKAMPLPDRPVELFIGVLSTGNHFAERMAISQSWMQHRLIKSSNVVARFFVALHASKEVNVELKKEAEFFGDIVIVPYMDSYNLVVVKTVAISEYAVHIAFAKAIMKCDDDTFVRLDAVLNEVNKVPDSMSFYIGNINYYHRPLRSGKWAVAYEEWPEEVYPPYANGPGYMISSDIAHFIVSKFKNHKLKLFKMEDVSMGMWVESFNSTKPVEYVHSLKFCQSGCIQDYYTAHYQSPRQIMCLWNNLQKLGKPICCNMR